MLRAMPSARLDDTIDHSPCAHDDVANVVAGLAHCAINQHSASVSELRI